MSRLIVKNLPKSVTDQKIRDVFGQKGTITDVQLKYKDGKFRQFGFVGYEDENSASEAVKFFDQTFIGTSRIKVEICSALGDESKPKAWSKYAKDSESFKKQHAPKGQSEDDEQLPEPPAAATVPSKTKSKKTTKVEAIIAEHKDDPQFLEFMKSHAKDNLAWENDLGIAEKDDEEPEPTEIDMKPTENKIANLEISDLDYMTKLMTDTPKPIVDDNLSKKPTKEKKLKEDLVKLFTVKIRNIPKKIKREELIKFFRPSKAFSVRIPHAAGYAYVGFKVERDLQRALSKDKSFLKGKQVHVYDFTDKNFSADPEGTLNQRQNPRWQQQQDQLKREEDICDSGKLFFRNLAYTVSEDDVQKLFEKYGAVVEVNVPIDSISRKIKVKKKTL